MASPLSTLSQTGSTLRGFGALLGSIGEGNTPLKTQVQALLAEGGDAQSNLFDISITYPEIISNPPGSLGGLSGLLPSSASVQTDSIRAGGFTPPQFKVETYNNKYLTSSATLVKPEITGERKFSIEFRVDAFYQIYKKFSIWRNAFYSPETGLIDHTRYSDPSYQGVLSLAALGSPLYQFGGQDTSQRTRYQDDTQGVTDGMILPTDLAASAQASAPISWIFQGVAVTAIEPIEFKTGEANPQKIRVEFVFQDFDTPEYEWDTTIQTAETSQT